MAFLMLSYIPSVSILVRDFFLNILGVEIYQVLFCLLRQSRGCCLPLVGVGTVTLTDVCIEPSL